MAAKRTESVERALSILTAFTAQKPRLSLAELADETALHKSTILRLVNSMGLYGFINKGEDGKYTIGASIWRLGLIFGQDFKQGEDIRPALRDLVEQTGETASFYVRAGDDRVCLYRENSPDLMRYHLEEGIRLDAYSGSSGLIFQKYAGVPVDDPAAVNENGTATSLGRRNPHISSIAAPVFSGSGELLGALAVSGPITRFDEAARTKAIPVLEKHARELSASL